MEEPEAESLNPYKVATEVEKDLRLSDEGVELETRENCSEEEEAAAEQKVRLGAVIEAEDCRVEDTSVVGFVTGALSFILENLKLFWLVSDLVLVKISRSFFLAEDFVVSNTLRSKYCFFFLKDEILQEQTYQLLQFSSITKPSHSNHFFPRTLLPKPL